MCVRVPVRVRIAYTHHAMWEKIFASVSFFGFSTSSALRYRCVRCTLKRLKWQQMNLHRFYIQSLNVIDVVLFFFQNRRQSLPISFKKISSFTQENNVNFELRIFVVFFFWRVNSCFVFRSSCYEFVLWIFRQTPFSFRCLTFNDFFVNRATSEQMPQL